MKCPGQDPRYWKFDAIFDAACPHCGATVEFFKDETRRTCRSCGKKVLNPKMDFGCAAHCKFAEQCFGDLPPELIKQKEDLLKDRVAIEMKLYFKSDFRRIGHAAKVARYAEKLLADEHGSPAVVLAAAYLHDIGIKESEKKYNSTAARYQHLEGPPVARDILDKLDAPAELIEEVCDIIGHHHNPRPEETPNYRIVFDADLIVNLEDMAKAGTISAKSAEKVIDKRFLTESGKHLARSIVLEPAGSRGNAAA
jgi:HD superfamily phosphodiesterase